MMKIFKQALFIVGLLSSTFSINVHAKTESVEATGWGPTKETAIESALINAIKQVNGVDVNSASLKQMSQLRTQDESLRKIALDNVTQMKSKGQIKSYQIISDHCADECEVVLSVQVPKYKSPGLSTDKRRKIAVVPFSGRFARDFSDNLQMLLVQSRRFAVLDREHDRLYQNEKHLLLSADTAISEKMRLGQVLGLDYLVVGELSPEYSAASSLTGENAGQRNKVHYKIINLATRQIKWQDQMSLIGDLSEIDSARQLTRVITDAIYPIKVISQGDRQLILNQGGKNIIKDSLYSVYALGEKLIDPYTKESLGREESYLGQVKIVRVNTKVSYAELVEGDYKKMRRNSILRFADGSSNEQVGANSTLETSSAGGVLLPLPAAVQSSPKGGVILK